ncbi:hypothetical protein D3C71_1993200 [compost metagenome]
MTNACITEQRAHVTGTEHVPHQAAALVHVKGLAIGRNNPGCVLTTVLQQLQTVIQQLVYG